MTGEEISAELRVPLTTCREMAVGSTVMSPDQQLQLATLLIERVPRLARRGYTLRAQVLATAAFTEGVTALHQSTPGRWSALKRPKGR